MSSGQEQQTDLEVLDTYFQHRRSQVPVLQRRAEAEGIEAICSFDDMVPLLFPHTTYKSYPETLIANGRWGHMNRWLSSLSTAPIDDVDVEGCVDVDDWIDRLTAAGHLVSSSSGTTGKASFLHKTQRDRDASLADILHCLEAQDVPPATIWNVVPVGPDTGISHHNAVRDLILSNYAKPDSIPLPQPKVAADGHHSYMSQLAAMRRAMADGTAKPDEVAAFEAASAARQQEQEDKLRYFAEEIYRRRADEPIFFHAMVAPLFRLVEILRELGASEGDITGGNVVLTGGGVKGIDLPADYQQQISRMLNISPDGFLQYYSMQELNVRMPKCPERRYHVPTSIVLFVLDKEGERLERVVDGVVEGRAAFFDETVDGRWGGTISGDKITAHFDACPCGKPGVSIDETISRYSDLADGDKITCAGTVDAYVRGFIDD